MFCYPWLTQNQKSKEQWKYERFCFYAQDIWWKEFFVGSGLIYEWIKKKWNINIMNEMRFSVCVTNLTIKSCENQTNNNWDINDFIEIMTGKCF